MFEPEYHLQVRVPDAVTQQHGGPETDLGGLAGRGGAGAEGEDVQAGDLQRGRQKEETHVYRGPGEALPGGLFRRAAEALVGEDRRNCGETGPEKERGPGLVLQSEAKAETNEVFCHALRPAGGNPWVSAPFTKRQIRDTLLLHTVRKTRRTVVPFVTGAGRV